jgi:hypothetical protein
METRFDTSPHIQLGNNNRLRTEKRPKCNQKVHDLVPIDRCSLRDPGRDEAMNKYGQEEAARRYVIQGGSKAMRGRRLAQCDQVKRFFGYIPSETLHK